jgi:hypothetical protein
MSLPPPGARRPRWPTVLGAVLGILMAAFGLVAVGFVVVAVIALNNWNGKKAAVVMAAGLALSAAYSLRPVRVADRGAAASLLLPACYVAVPYLTGVLGARPDIQLARRHTAGRALRGLHRPDPAERLP